MSVDRTKTLVAAGALVLSALAPEAETLRALTSRKLASLNRDQPTIAPADRDKMKAELLAARDRQASTTAAKDAAAKDTTTKCRTTADTGAAGRPC